MKAILDEMLAALSRGERVVLSSILASSGSVPRGAGAKMAVFEDDRVLGTIGGGAVERLSIQRAGTRSWWRRQQRAQVLQPAPE